MTLKAGGRVANRSPLVSHPESLAPRVLGAVTVVCVLGLAAVYALFVRTGHGQSVDATLFGRFQQLPYGGSAGLIRDGVIVVASGVVAVLAVIALWHRRWRVTSAALVPVLVSLWLAELLKVSLDRPYLGSHAYPQNTFPSAHMATATALAIAVVVLWPRAGDRWSVAVAALIAVALEAVYNVTGFAHRPSDVVGGFLLAIAVCSVSLVACGVPADARWRHDARLS
jgi:membrane-associated phospholipid phosphatase